MKVLSILQPWASLIIKGHKKIETRSWTPKNPAIIKQLEEEGLLIHASAKKIRLQDGMYNLIDHMERIGFMNDYDKLPYGAIIGPVKVVDRFSTNGINYNSHGGNGSGNVWSMSHQEIAFGDYSADRFGWVLSDPVEFEVPIPARGQLNLWNHPGTFKCKGCGHELPLEVMMRTIDYCHLCDPNVTLKELLQD